jgi:aspartyl-tRNA(Asn)/glutamyl-tRNA(Gln) amidotransferase subunit C
MANDYGLERIYERDGMTLTRAEVEHVARLARMRLHPEELEQMRVQLSAILDYIETLQEVEVEGVPVTDQITGLQTLMRPDVVTGSLTQEQVLANAPDQRDGMFRVRAILDEV